MPVYARVLKSEPVWISRELKDLPKPSTEGVVWYILYCNIASEAKAAWGLVDRGIDVHCPLSRRMARSRHTKKSVEYFVPAFPRYLFVGMSGRTSWWDVRQVEGIESVICNNLVPVKVPHALIARLMKHQAEGCFDQYPPVEILTTDESQEPAKSPEFALKTGDLVELIRGPFAGVWGTVVKAPRAGQREATIEFEHGTIKLPLAMMMPTA